MLQAEAADLAKRWHFRCRKIIEIIEKRSAGLPTVFGLSRYRLIDTKSTEVRTTLQSRKILFLSQKKAKL